MSGDAQDEKGFVIKDRRFFDEEGKTREEGVTGEEKAAPEEKPEPPPREEAATKEPDAPADTGEIREESEEEFILPEMNFPTFILSLHTSALFHLGLIPDPRTNENVKNIAAAKQTIDILDMLEKKTQGNLEEEERKLLEGILFELKMAYVKTTAAS